MTMKPMKAEMNQVVVAKRWMERAGSSTHETLAPHQSLSVRTHCSPQSNPCNPYTGAKNEGKHGALCNSW